MKTREKKARAPRVVAPGLPSRILALSVVLAVVRAVSYVALAWGVARVIDGAYVGARTQAFADMGVGTLLDVAGDDAPFRDPAVPAPLGQYVQVLGLPVVVAILSIVAIGVATILNRVLVAKAIGQEESWLRTRLLGAVFARGYSWLASRPSAGLANTVTDGVERVGAYRVGYMGPAVASLVVPAAVICGIGVTIDWVIAGVLACLLPLIPLIVGGFQSAAGKAPQTHRRARAALASRFLDSLQGLSALRLINAHTRQAGELSKAGDRVRVAVMKVLARNQLIVLIIDATFAAVLLVGGSFLALRGLGRGDITAGQSLSVIVLIYTTLSPVEYVGAFFYIGLGGRASQKAIRDILDGVSFGEPPEPASTAVGAKPAGRISSIRLRNLGFAYGDTPVLRQVNVDFEGGKHSVLRGESGGGKSTLLALLQGLIVPDTGEITIQYEGTPGDAALGNVGETEEGKAQTAADFLLRNTALVGQGGALLSGTIADNLRLAKAGAKDAEMWRVLEAVCLAEEARWMQGLDTVVGELGHGVSGGQAQRIAIARALLADRPILLLDEPTSSLDGVSEKLVLEAIATASVGRTVVSVAHRPSAVGVADRVYTVRAGGVVIGDERGR
ncbi:MAG: ATP-binding cassette domain-containing protein [Actinomycetaceae bacterium]|nr:ATP-binding cassette domain-containing protein [Actinomycetaceae bacterium]